MATTIQQELTERQCLSFSGKGGVPKCQWIGTSGAHLDGYFCLDRASPDLKFLHKVTRQLISPFVGLDIQTVITPAIGSIPLSTLVAEELMATGISVSSVWADKVASEEPSRASDFDFIRPGYAELVAGTPCLIVEDVINKMHTVSRVRDRARALGARIVGVASVATLYDVDAASLNVPILHSLCQIRYNSWTPSACAEQGPCSRYDPIVVDPGLGHGAEYQ